MFFRKKINRSNPPSKDFFPHAGTAPEQQRFCVQNQKEKRQKIKRAPG